MRDGDLGRKAEESFEVHLHSLECNLGLRGLTIRISRTSRMTLIHEPSRRAFRLHPLGTPGMGVILWRGSPLCETGSRKESRDLCELRLAKDEATATALGRPWVGRKPDPALQGLGSRSMCIKTAAFALVVRVTGSELPGASSIPLSTIENEYGLAATVDATSLSTLLETAHDRETAVADHDAEPSPPLEPARPRKPK